MSDTEIKGNDPTGAGQIIVQTDLIKAETEKIDNAASDGLTGVAGSVAYEVGEIERHHHNWERWLAAAAVPAGETHVADPIADNPVPFVVDAGNDTPGAWLQIGGSDDTPVRAGQVKFDLHRIEIVDWEHNSQLHIVQIAFGASGAAAFAAGDYTEFPFTTGVGTAKVNPIDVLSRRQDAGTKCWIRTFAPSQNTSTISVFIGIHEYVG